jgi:endonuclease/exonuclease/phosphatase family metal-dependent hydrolase
MSGGVLVSQVQKIAGESPAIAVGDYNSREESKQVQDILSLLNDAYRISETAPAGPVETDLGGGNFLGPAKARIDYLFVSKNVTVEDYLVIDDKRPNGHYPSDHLPIVCSIKIE